MEAARKSRLRVTLVTTVLLLAGTEVRADVVERFEAGLQVGYRVDDFDWNIASDLSGQDTPTILSELIWSDLETFQMQSSGQLVAANRNFPVPMKLRWLFAYGWITDGDNQDSDYAGDDRTLEFSRSVNNGGDGSMLDASVAIGPLFRAGSRFTLAPLIGYSYHEQNLSITDGYQAIDTTTPVMLGPFPGLDSRYETQWWGVWLGLDAGWRPWDSMEVVASGEFHFAEFRAEADWNLRTDLAHPVSFEQWGNGDFGFADGYGVVLGLSLKQQLSRHLLLSLDGSYHDWQIRNGIDRVYMADGSIADTKLNEVNWQSWSVMLGLSYHY